MCFFANLINNVNGGAIYCNQSPLEVLIEDSSFVNCKGGQSGGGIFCSGNVGFSIMHRLCGYKCYLNDNTDSWGLFICSNHYVKSVFDYVSASHCYESVSTSNSPLRMNFGIQRYFNINSSDHKIGADLGVACIHTYDSIVRFACLDRNTGERINIVFHNASGTVSFCNMINNSVINYGMLFVNANGRINAENCYLYKNIGLSYSVYSGIITVVKCYSNSHSSSGNVVFVSTYSFSQETRMTLLSTYHCPAIVPFIYPTLNAKLNVHQDFFLLLMQFLLC